MSTLRDIAEALAACKQWCWLPGMTWLADGHCAGGTVDNNCLLVGSEGASSIRPAFWSGPCYGYMLQFLEEEGFFSLAPHEAFDGDWVVTLLDGRKFQAFMPEVAVAKALLAVWRDTDPTPKGCPFDEYGYRERE